MKSMPHNARIAHVTPSRVLRSRRFLFSTFLIVFTAFASFTPQALKTFAATTGPALSIDASVSYAINPDIYGACGYGGPSAAFAQEIKLPLCRWGGDSTSRYNWQVNASNSGVDFWFLGGGSSSSTPGANVDAFVDNNNSNGARSLITIPVIPYIEKSNNQLCAFSIKKYGYNNVAGWGAFWSDWNGQGPNGVDQNYDCADGVVVGSGAYFHDNDPHDTSTENSPDIQKAWVQHLVQRYGPSSQSRIIYQLDNEPSNWGYLHRDVYKPSSLSYTDLINYSIPYAAAIKQADPTAQVAGPSDIQFAWYPDWGGTSNMTQYLQAMKQYEQDHGQRLLDIFSVHYPDANDSHWPHLTDVDSVRQVVDQNYPGTKIGFDEWNFGSDTDALGGALATADQLGVFARDQVSEAAYWVLDDATKPAAYSFRMYRNYDGQGSQFGDTYLKSTTADDRQLSVYGARRSSDGALTVMVINKTANDLTSSLSLSGITPTGNAQVYNYSAANQSAIVHQADESVNASGLTHTFGANSITLLVIPTNGSTVTPTSTPTSGNWTKCADEGGTCTFSGTHQVRYGANGTYNYQTATGSIVCSNATFGDPTPGIVKHCDVLSDNATSTATATSTPTPTSTATTWTKCADEGGTCTFSGTHPVRYGANGTYNYQTATGSIACTNATFGDPTPGVVKACYYS